MHLTEKMLGERTTQQIIETESTPLKKGFTAGKITSIELHNFMNHDKFTFPNIGPNVNYITGNTGSGNTSIIRAVVLGFGGLAGHSCIEKCIKKDRNKAEIKVKLCNEGDGGYQQDIYGNVITFFRTIIRKGESSFALNGETLATYSGKNAHEQAQNIMKHFSINLDSKLTVINLEKAKKLFVSEDRQGLYDFVMKPTILDEGTSEIVRSKAEFHKICQEYGEKMLFNKAKARKPNLERYVKFLKDSENERKRQIIVARSGICRLFQRNFRMRMHQNNLNANLEIDRIKKSINISIETLDKNGELLRLRNLPSLTEEEKFTAIMCLIGSMCSIGQFSPVHFVYGCDSNADNYSSQFFSPHRLLEIAGGSQFFFVLRGNTNIRKNNEFDRIYSGSITPSIADEKKRGKGERPKGFGRRLYPERVIEKQNHVARSYSS